MNAITKIADPLVSLVWEILFMAPVHVIFFLCAILAGDK